MCFMPGIEKCYEIIGWIASKDIRVTEAYHLKMNILQKIFSGDLRQNFRELHLLIVKITLEKSRQLTVVSRQEKSTQYAGKE